MNTEIILKKRQLARNNRFNIQGEYVWSYTGSWTKTAGKITHTSGSSALLYQDIEMTPGVEYTLSFTISDRTSGFVQVYSLSGGTLHLSVASNTRHSVTFTAEGQTLIFSVTNVFDGAIQAVEITETPAYYLLDLTEDVNIPLTFSLDDLFNLGQRKTAFSKTITLPGTHNNNIAFNHIYKINSESRFDVIKTCPVVVKNGGMVAFTGNLSLDDIVHTVRNGEDRVSYQVTLIGKSFSFFDKFGTKTIKDLDFSRYDHELGLDLLRLNWSANFVVPGSIDGGMAYVWDNSTSPPAYTANQTITYTAPSVSSVAGASFNGNTHLEFTFSAPHSFSVDDFIFADTDNHYMGGTHTVVSVPSNTKIILDTAWANIVDATFTNIQTEARTWDAFGYWYPMGDNGHYCKLLPTGSEILKSFLYTIVQLGIGDDFSNICKDPVTGLAMTPVEGCTFLADDGSIAAGGTPIFPTSWNGASILQIYETPTNGGKLTNKNLNSNHWYPMDFHPHIFIREIWEKTFQLIDAYYSWAEVDSHLFRRLVMPMDMRIDVEELQTVVMNDWLPDMKLSDFFISILNIFNAVIIEDPEQDNLISIVSRNDFFNDTIKQWEIDASSPLKITLASSIVPYSFKLKYKDSQDFYNKDYVKDFVDGLDRNYGDKIIVTGNELNLDKKVSSLEFCPTVMAGNLPGIYDTFNVGYGQEKVFSVTYNAAENGTAVARKHENKILIAGLRGAVHPYSTTYRVFSLFGAVWMMDTVVGNYSGRQYAYATHIDNHWAVAPQDLNFDPTVGIYFPDMNYDVDQYKTLYTEYWQRYLLDILSKHSRLIEGRFKIPIAEISQLDFRNLHQILDYRAKLIKIVDWNVNSDGVCTCQFLLKNI